MVWADPENNLIYVFLSNRINPDIENKLLQKENIRARVHRVFYEAINDTKQH